MKDDYKLYKHVNKINNKVYIGITKNKPKVRWANGHGYKTCKLFYNAIIKYGWNNFDHEILFEGLSKELACQLETSYIEYFRERGMSYNIANGGEGTDSVSDETKKKISEKLKYRKFSDETKKKISQSKKGICHNLETKKKISETLKQRPRLKRNIIVTDETKEKMSKSHIGQIAWNKGMKMSDSQKNKLKEIHKGNQYRKDTGIMVKLENSDNVYSIIELSELIHVNKVSIWSKFKKTNSNQIEVKSRKTKQSYTIIKIN